MALPSPSINNARFLCRSLITTCLGLVLFGLIGCGTSAYSEQVNTVVYVTVTPGTAVTQTPLARLSPALVEPQLLVGSWGGEFKLSNQAQWTLLIAEFAAETTDLTVLIAFPLDAALPSVTSVVDFETTEGGDKFIRFAIPYQVGDTQDTLTFAGQLHDDKISGAVLYGKQEGVFELAPLMDFGPGEFKGRT